MLPKQQQQQKKVKMKRMQRLIMIKSIGVVFKKLKSIEEAKEVDK